MCELIGMENWINKMLCNCVERLKLILTIQSLITKVLNQKANYFILYGFIGNQILCEIN